MAGLSSDAAPRKRRRPVASQKPKQIAAARAPAAAALRSKTGSRRPFGKPFASATWLPRKPLTEVEYRAALAQAGFDEVEIHETHRVHEHAGAAIIRAHKAAA